MMLFRITPQEHERIRRYQLGHATYRVLLGKRLGLDHRHADGLVRGLLEWRLNRMLGVAEKVAPNNTAEMLRALADYLDTPPAVSVLGENRYGLIGQAKKKKKMIYGPPKE